MEGRKGARCLGAGRLGQVDEVMVEESYAGTFRKAGFEGEARAY